MTAEAAEGRVWLDVAFDSNDLARAGGARWDRDARCWYAPEGADMHALQEWLPLRWPDEEAAHRCGVVGLRTRCWRCRRPTVCAVGLRLRGCEHLLSFQDPLVKQVVQALLPDGVRRSLGVGRIRRRYSRTVGAEYISNGCVHCDALQGDFGLLIEDMAEVGTLPAADRAEMLPLLADTAIPEALADALMRSFFDLA